MQRLKISENRRYFVAENGEPFFWLGDTAWELFHRLDREQAAHYLQTRKEQGFNVIQAVALAELEGLTRPNAYGRFPLLRNEAGHLDPSLPDLTASAANAYTYWDHVDYVLEMAARMGIYVALLPAWGDKFHRAWGKGEDPEVFDPDNARVYGRWIGTRYKDASHLVWVLGGDRPLATERHFAIIRAMADGIREGGGAHLMTFHPVSHSSYHLHGDERFDFNMIQSGHHALDGANYEAVEHDYWLLPTKPVLDAEPRYEDHPVGFNPDNGFFRAYDVRQAAYWNVLAGGCGTTYGHHAVWAMNTEPGSYNPLVWMEALDRPAANQMRHLRRLIESRPQQDRVPDQSLVVNPLSGADHIRAARGRDYAFLYSATGQPIQARLGILSGDVLRATWYDPRTGAAHEIDTCPNQGERTFMPPTSGRGEDWVLLLDDLERDYAPPSS